MCTQETQIADTPLWIKLTARLGILMNVTVSQHMKRNACDQTIIAIVAITTATRGIYNSILFPLFFVYLSSCRALSHTPASLHINQTQHCKLLPGMVSSQAQLCRSNMELMQTIIQAAREVKKTCQKTFADMRWNCSSIEIPTDAPKYPPDLDRGTVRNSSEWQGGLCCFKRAAPQEFNVYGHAWHSTNIQNQGQTVLHISRFSLLVKWFQSFHGVCAQTPQSLFLYLLTWGLSIEFWYLQNRVPFKNYFCFYDDLWPHLSFFFFSLSAKIIQSFTPEESSPGDLCWSCHLRTPPFTACINTLYDLIIGLLFLKSTA